MKVSPIAALFGSTRAAPNGSGAAEGVGSSESQATRADAASKIAARRGRPVRINTSTLPSTQPVPLRWRLPDIRRDCTSDLLARLCGRSPSSVRGVLRGPHRFEVVSCERRGRLRLRGPRSRRRGARLRTRQRRCTPAVPCAACRNRSRTSRTSSTVRAATGRANGTGPSVATAGAVGGSKRRSRRGDSSPGERPMTPAFPSARSTTCPRRPCLTQRCSTRLMTFVGPGAHGARPRRTRCAPAANRGTAPGSLMLCAMPALRRT